MKPCHLIILTLMFSAGFARANSVNYADTTKKQEDITISMDHPPEFPGGIPAFGNYISRNIQYPEVARLIGINGRVTVSFVLDTSGRVTQVTPINCIGAGCEAEAARVLENSPRWKAGVQKGKLVNVRYAVPISFRADPGKITFKNLDISPYGFLFNIKGNLYTLTEAKQLLGDSFQSTDVEIVEPFYNADHNDKFNLPGKRSVYLVKIKTEPAASN